MPNREHVCPILVQLSRLRTGQTRREVLAITTAEPPMWWNAKIMQGVAGGVPRESPAQPPDNAARPPRSPSPCRESRRSDQVGVHPQDRADPVHQTVLLMTSIWRAA